MSDKDKRWIETAEIKNGRLAMLAITAFAAQEFVSHIAVVDQVPFFFKPITETWLASPTEVFPGLYDQEAAAQAAASAAAAVDSNVAATIMESATQATNEAVSAADTIAAATAEAATNSAAAAVDTAANTATPTVMESTTTATTIVPAPPTSVESVVADDLIVAKKRIAELEAQLSSIRDLTSQ